MLIEIEIAVEAIPVVMLSTGADRTDVVSPMVSDSGIG